MMRFVTRSNPGREVRRVCCGDQLSPPIITAITPGFADPAEAVAQACRAAKADAARGRVAIVSAQTAPQELHCYVPPGDAGAQACGLSRNPRLAANL